MENNLFMAPYFDYTATWLHALPSKRQRLHICSLGVAKTTATGLARPCGIWPLTFSKTHLGMQGFRVCRVLRGFGLGSGVFAIPPLEP